MGLQVTPDQSDRQSLVDGLKQKGYQVVDMTDNEVAKLHIRHMVGGHAPGIGDERVYRFEFPERPGALMNFLTQLALKQADSLMIGGQYDAAAAILADPAGFLGARLSRMAKTLSRRPSDYFFTPENWAALPALSPALVRGTGGPPGPAPKGAYRATLLALNLAAILVVLHGAVAAPGAAQRRFFLAAAAFGVVFLGVAYGANGAEQHRMRYTIHPLLWPCWFLLAERAARLAPRRRPLQRG